MPQSEKHFTPQSSEKSSESNPGEKSRWECNSFHCSWELHFASVKSRLAPLLYSWGRGLSYQTDSFHAAINNAAKYFGVNRTTVIAALQEMVERGWAEVIHKEPGKPVAYRFIDHEEWAREHPNKCVVKDEMPWEDEEGDGLAPRLHSLSGGLVKFYTGQMTGLRKSGLSDDQIATEFRIFLGSNPQMKRGKDTYYRFQKHLLSVADHLRDAANAQNSRSGVSAGTDTYQSAGTDTPSRPEPTPTSRLEPTQVFEFSPEAVPDGRRDTRPASQERLTSQPALQELSERGTASPFNPLLAEKSEMHFNKEKKESSAAEAPTRRELSPEEKLERKAYFSDQLAKLERLISQLSQLRRRNKEEKGALKGYRELKAHCEQKIAEYSMEVVTT